MLDIEAAQRMWKEREREQAECSPHAWDMTLGMFSREWAWRCQKCGKVDSGIERPPAT